MEEPQAHNGISDEVVQLPTPTAWPLVLALGLTFGFAGLVTNVGISILGAVLIVAGCVGWFGQVWPHAQHIAVPVKVQKFEYTTVRTKVARIEVDESHRARLPVHTPSVMAGVKGGIAGGAAMIVPALLYGLIRLPQHLVSDKSFGRRGSSRLDQSHPRGDHALPPECADLRHHHPCRGLAADRPALWGDAAHVAPASHVLGRHHRPVFMDRRACIPRSP